MINKEKCNDCNNDAQNIYTIYPCKKYYLCNKCAIKSNEFKMMDNTYLVEIKSIK
jgi:hypothetical protein